MLDIHTHTKFSHDGSEEPLDMAKAAEEMGLRYLAFTDHLDLDYNANLKYILVSRLNVPKQYKELTKLCSEYSGNLILATGIEVGYSHEVVNKYRKIIEAHSYDVVINSIHTINNVDLYFKQFYTANTRKEAFEKYLNAVLASVYADYPYDVIGHMGYILRYSPYSPKKYSYEEFPKLFDDILFGIIERGKTLEVNTKTKDEDIFMPSVDILKRYRELGGTLITLGSDAHKKQEIAGKFDEAAKVLKELGYKTLTAYKKREIIEFPL
jgi:histidinol-phosphatase (PHP family)